MSANWSFELLAWELLARLLKMQEETVALLYFCKIGIRKEFAKKVRWQEILATLGSLKYVSENLKTVELIYSPTLYCSLALIFWYLKAGYIEIKSHIFSLCKGCGPHRFAENTYFEI